MSILELPQEILSHILACLDARSVVRFGRTCKEAADFASPRNQLLWKAVFLHLFDDPSDAWALPRDQDSSVAEQEWDWYRHLKSRLVALRTLQTLQNGNDGVEDEIEAMLSIIDTAKFSPSPSDVKRGILPSIDDRDSSLNLKILADVDYSFRPGIEVLIHESRVNGKIKPCSDERMRVTRSMAATAQYENCRPETAARLHVLYGITIRERIAHEARGFARRKVYNWHLTGPDNEYGPFKRDGSGHIDWFLLEAICSVIGRNFEFCVDGHLNLPQGFCYSIPHRTLVDPTTPEDWARITGPWLGTYSFLDYADLFAFNALEFPDGERPTLDHEDEACGDLMRLELKYDQSISSDQRLRTDLPMSTHLPQLFFSGRSRASTGLNRPMIGVRGSVCLVPSGREARWRFIISYAGQDQWQLEGIQPGGVRSGGVYGLWSQCDHEEHGPVGPFCYFPTELCKPTSIVLKS
ncbi:uncharacterized protein A1O9_11266 [Exophiala aquamarina CBS 119918]|uniref:F-box domain-containing protein n=1 Tax=Exophiala aquamarina CBS 119918 TaxID=1182545 RepID=A0A072NYB4_9EURO|nr:uncharacterized protein A1O9_11266 [Exophiala aquamarina CBS 119918]KEF52849.1 hypothetical protein A1O9_11266 [Exophiala aquamarina CBS 119918]